MQPVLRVVNTNTEKIAIATTKVGEGTETIRTVVADILWKIR